MNAINHKTISFCLPGGKPIIPHLRRYQGFAVVHYSVTLDALYLGYPRLSLNRGYSHEVSSECTIQPMNREPLNLSVY